jgi:prepilin-type N-terminal cleavage/methylation domain-containing protein
MRRRVHTARPAFSLLEVAIVIVILGTIAAIAIPRVSRAAAGSREAALAASLRELNSAAERYAAEHEGRTPAHEADGSVTALQVRLARRLLRPTDLTGSVAGPFGPYLRAIPVNPINGSDRIRIDGQPAGSGRAGWRFDSTTGQFERDDCDDCPAASPHPPKPGHSDAPSGTLAANAAAAAAAAVVAEPEPTNTPNR